MTETYTVTAATGSRVKLRNNGGDGWCIASLKYNGVVIDLARPEPFARPGVWLENPCTSPFYTGSGLPCFPQIDFDPQVCLGLSALTTL